MSRKWDEYYYRTCKEVASNSKCLSRSVGAILVRDKSIISTGYNGPPRGVPHCNERYTVDSKLISELRKKGVDPTDTSNWNTCPRYVLGFKSGEGLEWCIAGHAERNCLINAAREGTCTKGSSIYMDCGIPCSPCLVEIINAGVLEVVVARKTYYDLMSEFLVKNSELTIRIYKHLCEHKTRVVNGICQDCGDHVL